MQLGFQARIALSQWASHSSSSMGTREATVLSRATNCTDAMRRFVASSRYLMLTLPKISHNADANTKAATHSSPYNDKSFLNLSGIGRPHHPRHFNAITHKHQRR